MTTEPKTTPADQPPPTLDPNVDALTRSAARWLRQALTGWANEDYSAVAMLAPVALEHLGKASLWKRNPALLVPLSANAEESLRILTVQPGLANTKLRTVGLQLVLQRVGRLVDGYPLTKDSAQRIVDARNGSIHVGAKSGSGDLLRNVLRTCEALLVDLDADKGQFYGDQKWNVQSLLDEQRTEVQLAVDARMARARNHLTDLEDKLGLSVFNDLTATLEAEAAPSTDPQEWLYANETAINRACPECGSQGRLRGWLDADPQPDWDQEKINGKYESFISGVSWDLTLVPTSFTCNVCKLTLDGPLELQAANLPASRTDIDEDDLDDDFEFNEFIRSIEQLHE